MKVVELEKQYHFSGFAARVHNRVRSGPVVWLQRDSMIFCRSFDDVYSWDEAGEFPDDSSSS